MTVVKLRNRIVIWIVIYNALLIAILLFQSLNSPSKEYVRLIWTWFLWSNIPIYLIIYLSYLKSPIKTVSLSKCYFIVFLFIIYGVFLLSLPIYVGISSNLQISALLFKQPNYSLLFIVAITGISYKPLFINLSPKNEIDKSDQPSRVKIFISYSHLDEQFMLSLNKHLSTLKRQNEIETWDDRCIKPGDDWKGQIDNAVNTAHIFLLLISSDFLGSDYCNDIELKRALERHEQGECTIIPIILRDCDWKSSFEIGRFEALPFKGRAISTWENMDSAFLSVVEGIRKLISKYN